MLVYRGWGAEPGTPTKVTISNPDGTSRTITASLVQAGPEVVSAPWKRFLPVLITGATLVVAVVGINLSGQSRRRR